MNDKVQLQPLPLALKDPSNETNIDFTMENCAVAVNFCIYDKRRRTIVSIGTSRPCGINRQNASLHAEELCIQFLKKSSNINRYQMYIYRYSIIFIYNLCIFTNILSYLYIIYVYLLIFYHIYT